MLWTRCQHVRDCGLMKPPRKRPRHRNNDRGMVDTSFDRVLTFVMMIVVLMLMYCILKFMPDWWVLHA